MVQPTISWAQDLHRIHLEVKFAHRFDAPGCANHTNVEIKIEDTQLTLAVLCISISSKIKYELNLPLWAPINVDASTYKYQAVGKYHFTLKKETSPGRWPQLHDIEFPKPLKTRLHLDWH